MTHHALYRRRIPALTETAARQGDSSARVCGDNQRPEPAAWAMEKAQDLQQMLNSIITVSEVESTR
ncbi:Rz1 family lipoprotein [Escherichia coli]|uniref:Rz1 family lipoprotein n=1 Tax=Escherichia coli TaxID=562 RepID=UPI003757662E